jgi:hypothetical protein
VNTSPLVKIIYDRLHGSGYSDLSTPFRVAGVEFPFTAAMRGRDGRALDLVLLVDTTTGDFGDRDGTRVRQRVEALSRALDVTGSRYVVTVILAGAMLSESIEALSETCRVLHVEDVPLDDHGKPTDTAAARQLDDRIRVLLPLRLPAPLVETEEGSGSTMEQLLRALPTSINKTLVDALIAASNVGEQAVTEALALVINDVVQSASGKEQL